MILACLPWKLQCSPIIHLLQLMKKQCCLTCAFLLLNITPEHVNSLFDDVYYPQKGFSHLRVELCDKRWFGFEIEHLLMARLFRIQYQNQYLCLLEIITDTDINIAQWLFFEFQTPLHFSCLGLQYPCKHLKGTLLNW